MILKESEIDSDIIKPILGDPYKEPGKLLTATGSTIYFLRNLSDLEGNTVSLKREEMKGIFQRYEKGLLLMFNGNNYQNAIPIEYQQISSIHLTKFEQIRNYKTDFFLNIIKSLSKLLPVRWIYNAFRYSNRETQLLLKTESYQISLYTSYSSLKSQVDYFSSLKLNGVLKVDE